MTLEQAYSTFNKLVIASSHFAKQLHVKYGDSQDKVPVERCEAMIRELEMANGLDHARMRPSWEFYRDCIGVKNLIEEKKDEFFTDGAKRIRRKEYLRADIGPIWNKLSKEDQDELWKLFKRAMKSAEKIHNLTPPEEQARLLRNWP